MPKIKIIADSTCDLSPELLNKHKIEIVPLYINLGDKVYKDGAEIKAEDIYRYVSETKTLPGTIGCSIEDFKKVFSKWHSEGYEIICHTISSDMSCTFQNAKIAAEDTGGVYVVDTRNLSSGGGHLVLNAALMAESGMAADKIVEELNRLALKVRASFILDNLDYMRKGGRCSSVTLFGSNLLKIKPEIVVENGTMKVGRKFRGPLKKVLENYVQARLTGSETIRTNRIFITHTGCSKEIIDDVKACINRHLHFDEIIETIASSTITSHCGPNTLGILYIVD